MFHKNKDAKTGSKPQETGEILRGEVVELHNDKLLAKGVLMDRDESRKRFGLNGDVLAVIEMPPSEEGFRKQIGIVDFGKTPEGEKHHMMWDPEDDRPIKMFSTKNRFALFGLNYSPRDFMAAYEQIPDTGITIGRDREKVGGAAHRLGLDDAGSDAVSGAHAVINVDPNGVIYIEDMSKNGTSVRIADRVPVIVQDAQQPTTLQ